MKETTKNLLTSIGIFVLFLTIVVVMVTLTSGCTMPFSGDRDVQVKLNILSNTFEWSSKMSGQYSKCESPVVMDVPKR